MDHETIDIYVRPNIHRFGLLEYNRYDEIVQAGYDAATVSIKVSEEGSWNAYCWAYAQTYMINLVAMDACRS